MPTTYGGIVVMGHIVGDGRSQRTTFPTWLAMRLQRIILAG